MKIGIIGCGLIGKKRAYCFNKNQIKIVSDIDSSNLKFFKNKFNCQITKNYKNVIKSDVQIIFVCTPHFLLSKIAIECLKNKKHVFIEKPGTINKLELNKIKLISKKYNLKVKIGFNHRYHPSIILSKKIIEKNTYGKILFLKASYGHGGRKNYDKEWRFDIKKSGGGELIDQGSHLIDLAVYFLGDLKVDYAFLKDYFWKKNIDDNIFVSLVSKNKQLAWLNASWTEWKNSFNFEIICEFGKLKISGLGKSYGIETLYLYKMNKNLKPPKEKIYKFKKIDDSWNKEVKDFLNSIKYNKKINGSIEELFIVSKIILEAYKKNNNKINYNFK